MEIERIYGVRNNLVAAWVKRYLKDGEDALEPRNRNPYVALHSSKSLNEVGTCAAHHSQTGSGNRPVNKGIGRSTLLAAERLRSHRRTA